jgi:hypothetical protein
MGAICYPETSVSVYHYELRNIAEECRSHLLCGGSLKSSLDHHHHHKHQGLDPLIRSVSRVTVALSNVSSVFQLFSFLVVCGGMISRGLDFVAFFASVKASLVCIHLSCPVCMQSAVHVVWSHLLCGHGGCSLPEVSIISSLDIDMKWKD